MIYVGLNVPPYILQKVFGKQPLNILTVPTPILV